MCEGGHTCVCLYAWSTEVNIGSSCFLSPQITGICSQILPIYVGSGNPNSGPHSCPASSLLTEACPWTLSIQFDEWEVSNLEA